MNEIQDIIIKKLDRTDIKIDHIESDISEIKEDLRYHIKRTDDLQEVVQTVRELVSPIYQKFEAVKAVDNYKQEVKKAVVYYMKIPSYIVACGTALFLIFTWLMRK